MENGSESNETNPESDYLLRLFEPELSISLNIASASFPLTAVPKQI